MSKRLAISFVTTLRHNVGDDFVRDGIRAVLDSVCDYDSYFIHKHNSESSCTMPEPEDEGPPIPDKILDADIVINAGAPVYWNLGNLPRYKCSNEEWIEPLWYRRISRVYRLNPILNLAAGACQGYHGSSSEIAGDPECARFIRDIHEFCRLIVVRDSMAEEVNNLLNLSVMRAPCASIHAWRRHRRPSFTRNRVALNFMPCGGHYEIGGSVDHDRWARSFLEIDRLLSSAGMEVVLVAHDTVERASLQELLPERPIFYSADYHDYFAFYGSCAGGIFNRIHGAMLLAGAGSPAVLIGNDSRSRTIDELDLPRYYVGEVAPKEAVERLCEMLSTEKQRDALLTLEAKSFERITALVRQSLFGANAAPAKIPATRSFEFVQPGLDEATHLFRH